MFRRPPRSAPPQTVTRQVEVRPPPPLPDATSTGASSWFMMLPALGGLGSMALIFTAGGGGTQIAAGVMFGVSALAMAGGSLARVGGERNRKVARERRAYQEHLAQIRRQVRAAAADQAESLFWVHPDPRGLLSLVRTSRLWERRPSDPDFAVLRIGVGDCAPTLDLPLGDAKQAEDVDLVSAVSLRRLLRANEMVHALPVAVPLRAFGRVSLEGEPAACRRLATAMVLQAIVWHAPTEFRIALCVNQSGVDTWDWLKWAPQLADRPGRPVLPQGDSAAPDLTALEELLADDLAGRPWATQDCDSLVDRSHVLVVVDGGRVGGGGKLADANGLQGVTVLDLYGALPAGSSTRTLRLRVAGDAALRVSTDRLGKEVLAPVAVPDAIGPAQAAAVSRSIAAKAMPDEVHGETLLTATGLTDLLGVTNVSTLDPKTAWRTRQARDRLRVPIGAGVTGQAVELDLKEAARGGMGPHGLVVGATGSGKSELLRTLVLGLAMTHPPESLNFVLIDFKGGATFARLDALPHTSAVITNLSDELIMVDRMKDAINGEMHRRMDLLRAAGHFASLQDYEIARTTTGLVSSPRPLPEIPSLLIVVDEFSELLSAKPEFLDLFVTIGRVGRSLGVHLLLASQRLEEGRLRGLDTYLSYRIGLKTFSGAESRIVLGVPDAFELPTAPGNGYLKFDTGSLLRFKSAYVSGPLRGQAPPGDERRWSDAEPFRLTLPSVPSRARLDGARPDDAGPDDAGPDDSGPDDSGPDYTRPGVSADPDAVDFEAPVSDAPRSGRLVTASPPTPAAADSAVSDHPRMRARAGTVGDAPARTLLDVAVSRMAGHGTPAHEVWIPPLCEPPSLDLLLTDAAGLAALATSLAPGAGEVVEPPSQRTTFPTTTVGRTMGARGWPHPSLSVPIGWVDQPFEQRRGVLALDLSGSGGHVAIVGAPQTGKSTAVRSVVCALALTHSPDQVQVYCLDFGGGSLIALSGLPHIGVVAGRAHPDLVRRTIGMVEQIMSRREEAFAAHNIGSLRDWRERTKSGRLPVDGFGDIFLVVDGWGGVRDSFESCEAQIISIAARGLNFGVHVVLTASRWSEIRPALKDLVSSRVELRLGDPLDSDINSRAATGVPADRPGRGLTRDQHHLLTAVPRIDGVTSADGLASATAALVSTVAERWPDQVVPEVRLLPSVLRVTDLPAVETHRGYALGLDEDFDPVYWSPRADQHLLIFGEEQSGKTTLLTNLLRQISARSGPDQARFIIFDSRRQLLDLDDDSDQVIASATTGPDAANVVSANLDRLHRRLPAPAASAAEISRRAWWGSPADIFLVVDDFERFAASAPLVPLLPLLDHAGDIGLHLIIARQARGASRAMYDGFYTRLRDTGNPTIVLSTPEPEGMIYGKTRAQPRPAGRGVWVPRRGPDRIIQTTVDWGIVDGT